jgi:hypothetical protein
MGWLGRQVGYVVEAVRAEVPEGGKGVGEEVVYRRERVEEAEHPEMPGVVLRRRVVDEVVRGEVGE